MLLRLGVAIVFLGILIGGAAWLSHLDAISIEEITVRGNSVTPTDELVHITDNQLAGSYAYAFSKRNSAIYPKKAIISRIKDAYARVKDVSVTLDEFTTLEIHVTEREPYAMWCEGKMENTDEGAQQCYFLDETGYIYSKAPQFSGHVFFRFYNGIVESEPIGSYYLDEKDFRRVRVFVEAVRDDFGLNPVAYTTEGNGDGVIQLVADDREGISGEMRFDYSDDLGTVYENLEALLEKDAFKKAFDEGKALTFDYIDLRYGNKIFYKKKGEAAVGGAQEGEGE